MLPAFHYANHRIYIIFYVAAKLFTQSLYGTVHINIQYGAAVWYMVTTKLHSKLALLKHGGFALYEDNEKT